MKQEEKEIFSLGETFATMSTCIKSLSLLLLLLLSDIDNRLSKSERNEQRAEILAFGMVVVLAHSLQ